MRSRGMRVGARRCATDLALGAARAEQRRGIEGEAQVEHSAQLHVALADERRRTAAHVPELDELVLAAAREHARRARAEVEGGGGGGVRAHRPERRTAAAAAHVEAADVAVFSRGDEGGARGAPRDPFRVRAQRPLVRAAIGGAHVDRDRPPIEARTEEGGGLGRMPGERLHLVRVVAQRTQRASARALQVPESHRRVGRAGREAVALQRVPTKAHHGVTVPLGCVGARAAGRRRLLLLAARTLPLAPALLPLARCECLRRVRGELLLCGGGGGLGTEHCDRLQGVDDVEVPDLDVRGERADGREVPPAAAAAAARRKVEPRQAQWEDWQLDVVVRIQVVGLFLVDVRLEVAELLVGARAQQDEVRRADLEVVHFRVDLLVLFAHLQVWIRLIARMEHEVASGERLELVVIVAVVIVAAVRAAPLALRAALAGGGRRRQSLRRSRGCRAS